MATELNITLEQGKTFQRLLRWETDPIVYKPITAITQAAPAKITATGHSVPSGWRVAVTGARGMIEINASQVPPRASDMHSTVVIDANNIELNELSSADFTPYTSGGYLLYYTPVSLVGYTARMQIRDRLGGTELMLLNTTNTRLVLDTTNKTISIVIDAVDTALITWKKGVYDLELEAPSGTITMLLYGKVNVIDEVTTSEA